MSDAAIRVEIKAALLRGGEAWARGNAAAMEALLSPTFTHTDVKAKLTDRTTWLAYRKTRVGSTTKTAKAASRSAACRSKPVAYTKEGLDMPYIAHDTSVIYAAADTAAAALAEAEKDLRNRLPTEDIDEALKSLEVHEATTALANDSNSWVKWAYLKNGVACTPAEANDEDYRLGIAAATDGN